MNWDQNGYGKSSPANTTCWSWMCHANRGRYHRPVVNCHNETSVLLIVKLWRRKQTHFWNSEKHMKYLLLTCFLTCFVGSNQCWNGSSIKVTFLSKFCYVTKLWNYQRKLFLLLPSKTMKSRNEISCWDSQWKLFLLLPSKTMQSHNEISCWNNQCKLFLQSHLAT